MKASRSQNKKKTNPQVFLTLLKPRARLSKPLNETRLNSPLIPCLEWFMSRPRRYMFEREGWELSVVCVNLVQKLLTVSDHTDLFLVLSTLGTIFLILGEDTNKEHYLKHTKGVRSLMFRIDMFLASRMS